MFKYNLDNTLLFRIILDEKETTCMKRILSFVLMLMLIMSMTSAVYAQGSAIQVRVDQKPVTFSDASPFIDENNRTLVPLRAIGEAMGLTVTWDNFIKTASFTKLYTEANTPAVFGDIYVGKEVIEFVIGYKTAIVKTFFYPKGYVLTGIYDTNIANSGWLEVPMDTAATIRDSRTYAPVRYLADAFRIETKWNGATKSVELANSKSAAEVGLSIELMAMYDDYQAWVFVAGEGSKVKSADVLQVIADEKSATIRAFTADEKSAVNQALMEDAVKGSQVAGVVVTSPIEESNTYKYTFNLQVTMEDGTKHLVSCNDYFYFDGQGGYL